MGLDFRLEVGTPAFTNFILCTAWGGEAISLENLLIAARSSRRTLSWRKVYLPCVSAVLYALKTCAVAQICFPHKLQQASELIRQRFRLLGEGRTS